jgi:hypothetical protein
MVDVRYSLEEAMAKHVQDTRSTQIELMPHSSYDQMSQWMHENTQAPGALTHHSDHQVHAETFDASYEPARYESTEEAAAQQHRQSELVNLRSLVPLALIGVVLVYVYRN